jgi:hypothetical protein
MAKYLLIIFLFISTSAFTQWVNPETNRPSETPGLQNTSPESSAVQAPAVRYTPPGASTQASAETNAEERGTHSVSNLQALANKRPVREINENKKLFKKLSFTFDGRIELLEPTINRDLTELYIATFNDKKNPVLIEFDGRRPFKIKITYDNKGKLKSMIWTHFDKDFLKYEYKTSNRYFIKINIFNFIRTTKTLLIPQLDVYEKKYFLRMEKDKFKRMIFKLEAKRNFARSLKEYFIAYFNKEGLWNIAQKYEKYGNKFKLKSVYYCIYGKNGNVQNLRVFDVDEDEGNTLTFDRSYFYDYTKKKLISVWEIYIEEEGKYWEDGFSDIKMGKGLQKNGRTHIPTIF